MNGQRPATFYAKQAVLGFTIGLPLIAWGLWLSHARGWEVAYSFFIGAQWNYWGSILVSFGWMGLILWIWKTERAGALVDRLSAVGRMAFTCYILETFICSFIFYGSGFGLFGKVNRLGQMVIVLGVWAVLLLVAPLWLERFRYGPLEWVWRMLTYGNTERLSRRRAISSIRAI